MKKRLPAILLSLLFLAGLSLLLYPTVSDRWNSLHQSRVVTDYEDAVSNVDRAAYDALLRDAAAYNEALAAKSTNRFRLTDEERAQYEALLDIVGTGVMGFVEIPAIGVRLPLYHGTSDAVLSVGIGHLEGSSLPVGGAGTHCVISGHRGLPSAKLLTDLDKMQLGDVFYLHILNETLIYEVDQILVVEPDELDALEIRAGEDLCTLFTCTPYGINSHRLLVRGHRVEPLPPETEPTEPTEPTAAPTEPTEAEPNRLRETVCVFAAPAALAALAALVLAIALLRKRRIHQKKK